MIGMLTGTAVAQTLNSIILEVQGVGYLVNVPVSVVERVQSGNKLQLHTHLSVREDSLTLYGFIEQADKEIFELLISVSGIGPRLGLAILSAFSYSDIIKAIQQNQPELFSSVSGIGKKNAQRIILELKNKLPVLDGVTTSAIGSFSEIQAALEGLGYTAEESRKVIKDIDNDAPLSDQIKQALAILAKPQS